MGSEMCIRDRSNTGVFEIDEILPRVAVEFDVTDDALLYGLVSTGIRNGNLNPSSSAFFGSGGDPDTFTNLRVFSEDEVLSYEIGAKTTWLSGDLTANVALFHTTFDDPQVESATPFVLVQNGPELQITGIELETAWQVNEYIDAYFNGAYQDTSFQEGFLLAPASAAAGFPFDLQEGNEGANSPEWSYSFGANGNYPLRGTDWALTGNVSYSYTGSRFSTVTNAPSSEMDPLNILNLRAGVENDAWSVVAFVSNATNDVEFTSISGSLGVPVVTANGELDFIATDVAVNRPRTIGVEAIVRF